MKEDKLKISNNNQNQKDMFQGRVGSKQNLQLQGQAKQQKNNTKIQPQWRPSKTQAQIYAQISRGLIDVLREYQLVGDIPKSALRAILNKKSSKSNLPPILPPQNNNTAHFQTQNPQQYEIFSKVLNSITNDASEEGSQDVQEAKKTLIKTIIRQRELLRSSYLKKRDIKRKLKQSTQIDKQFFMLKFQAKDFSTSQIMQSKAIAANFLIKIPKEDRQCTETLKTLRLYLKNKLKLDSVKQVVLEGIQKPSDLFLPEEGRIIMKGKLRDQSKMTLILYQVYPDLTTVKTQTGDQSSGSDDDEAENEESSSSHVEVSYSHTETEKSLDSRSKHVAETDIAEMVANIISLLVIKKQEKIMIARQQAKEKGDNQIELTRKEKREQQRAKWQMEQQNNYSINQGKIYLQGQKPDLPHYNEDLIIHQQPNSLVGKQFSFSEKFREMKNSREGNFLNNQDILQHNQDSFLNIMKQDSKQQHSIMSLIGQHYAQESLKSLSQEENQYSQQRTLIRPQLTNSNDNNKVRSFTQLLRKASSRGSHNINVQNVDDNKDSDSQMMNPIRPTQVLNSFQDLHKKHNGSSHQPSQGIVSWLPHQSFNNASIGYQDNSINYQRQNLFTPSKPNPRDKTYPSQIFQRSFNQEMLNSNGIQQMQPFLSPIKDQLVNNNNLMKSSKEYTLQSSKNINHQTIMTNNMMFMNQQEYEGDVSGYAMLPNSLMSNLQQQKPMISSYQKQNKKNQQNQKK